MHPVTSSARTRHREQTSARIARCAQRLTDERGLDGFTMEDLADAAEVSRRTLFNYFPGKVDAVLGPEPELRPRAVELFRAKGPSGDLVTDLRVLLGDLLEAELDSDLQDRDQLLMWRRMLKRNPRLMAAVHERYEALSATTVAHVAAREGAGYDLQRARVAVAVLAVILDTSLQAFLDDPAERPLNKHFDEALATARFLLGA